MFETPASVTRSSSTSSILEIRSKIVSSDVRIVQTKEKDTNLIKSSDFENNFNKDEINDLRIVKLMENSTINNLRKQV